MFIPAVLSGVTGRITNLTEINSIPGEKPEQSGSGFRSTSYDKLVLTADAIQLNQNVEKRQTTKAYSAKDGSKHPNEGLGLKKQKGKTQNTEKTANSQELSDEDQKEVEELKQTEQEVVQHENAHKSAGAPYTASPSYEYTTGPDGGRYISGGSVNIDTSEEATPEETIQKARVIKKAALAPNEPSEEDRSVANQASLMEARARRELQTENTSASDSEGNKEVKKAADVYAFISKLDTTKTTGLYVDLAS